MGKSRRNRSGAAARRRADPLAGGSGSGRPAKAVKAPTDPALAALREARVLPVMRDLRSAAPATRTAAAGAVAHLVAEDARCRKLLLREQVVAVVLGETLADAAVESRAAGWAVLAVLAQHEEADFCVHLYRSDVLTPAARALGQVRATLAEATTGAGSGAGRLTPAQLGFLWRTTAAVLDLVSLLADARDEILSAVAADVEIRRALFALAGSSSSSSGSSGSKNKSKGLGGAAKTKNGGAAALDVPFDIQWAALTCLARLCEGADSRGLAEAMVDDAASDGLLGRLRALQAGGGPLAVAATAVLHAVFAALEWFDHSPGRDGASDAMLVPTLAAAVAEQLEDEGDAGDVGDDGSEARDRSTAALGLALQTLAMMGTALGASLQKGNRDEEVWNGFADEGEDAEDMHDVHDMHDVRDSDASDADMDADMDDVPACKAAAADGMGADMDMDDDDGVGALGRDMAAVTGLDGEEADEDGAADAAGGLDDMPTLRALARDAVPALVRLVMARVQDADAASAAAVRDALAALNNVAWTVSLVDGADAGNAALVDAWAPVARRVWRAVVRPLLALDLAHADRRVAAQVIGLAWALARVLGGATPADAREVAQFMALRDAAASKMDNAEDANGHDGKNNDDDDDDDDDDENDDPFQSLPVKCVGVLGRMALDPAPEPQNRAIGRYLLGIVDAPSSSSSSAAQTIEALNQLFDVYGDEAAPCDAAVFWADRLLPAFEAALPRVKAMAKAIDKRAQGELRARADEVILNLSRFVQYKKKRAPRGGQGS